MNRWLKNLAQKIGAQPLTPEKRAEIEARVVWAASEDDLGGARAQLDLLAAAGVSRIKARDEGRRTALAWTAANGDAEGMRLLAPWCDQRAVSSDGDNLLMEAARNGDAGCILFAVEIARKHHLKTRSALGGETVFHAAARVGCADPQALRALADIVGANTRDREGATALHVAAWAANFGAVRSLMKICDPQALDEMLDTALGNAVITYSPRDCAALECVKLLATVCPVNATNKNGTTPLLIAANAEDDKPLKELMRKADWAIKDAWGRDAFDLAAKAANDQKHFACLDALCAVFPLERVKKEFWGSRKKNLPTALARIEAEALQNVVARDANRKKFAGRNNEPPEKESAEPDARAGAAAQKMGSIAHRRPSRL